MIGTIRFLVMTIVTVIVALSVVSCGSTTKDSPREVKAQAFESLKENARSVITDPERANDAVELFAQLERDFVRAIEDRAKYRKEFAALNADYDAPKEAFVSLTERLEQTEQVQRQNISNVRAEIVRVTTADEWRQLAKLQEEAIKAGFKALQAGN